MAVRALVRPGASILDRALTDNVNIAMAAAIWSRVVARNVFCIVCMVSVSWLSVSLIEPNMLPLPNKFLNMSTTEANRPVLIPANIVWKSTPLKKSENEGPNFEKKSAALDARPKNRFQTLSSVAATLLQAESMPSPILVSGSNFPTSPVTTFTAPPASKSLNRSPM